jgi:Domain of unknown function (DUF4397)
MPKAVPLMIGLLFTAGLLLAAGCGGGGKTRFRFMNAVPDIADLDVLVDTKTVSSNVAYSTATQYQSVAAGSRQVEAEISGTSNALINQPITFGSGTDTTVFAANFQAAPSTFVVFTDNNSTPSTNNFNLRVINMSPGLGPANIYVETPGTDINTVSPTVSALGFGSASNYLSMTANSYEITVTSTGGGIEVPAQQITFSTTQVRTFVILDDQGGACCTDTILSDLN